MSGTSQFTLGAEVSCTDGVCGYGLRERRRLPKAPSRAQNSVCLVPRSQGGLRPRATPAPASVNRGRVYQLTRLLEKHLVEPLATKVGVMPISLRIGPAS